MPPKGYARKPRVIVKCVANQYTGLDERIIEFSFPALPNSRGVPGGLIRFHNRGDGLKPLAEVYRTEGEVDVIAPRVELWAAYVGMAEGDGITLHRTEREALESCAEAMGVPLNAPDDPQQVRDDEELREALDEESNGGSRDWCVERVTTP